MGLWGSDSKERTAKFEAYDAQRRVELKEIEERWYGFLDKLEIRYNELIEEGREEGRKLFLNDSDPYRGTYTRFKYGWAGQLHGIISKAREVEKDKIIEYTIPREWQQESKLMYELNDYMEDWLERCRDYHTEWEHRIENLEAEAVKHMEAEDLEVQYNEIISEYNTIKDNFACQQCGAKIPIDQLYFISTYIPCGSCQTQNTFRPSTRMSFLSGIARPLSEQRCIGLRNEYEALTHDRSGKYGDKELKQKELDAYVKYQRGVFDEMNKIIPSMKEQNEKFYSRIIEDFKRHF